MELTVLNKEFYENLFFLSKAAFGDSSFVVCDIGALDGAHPLFTPIAKYCTLVAFDPNPDFKLESISAGSYKKNICVENGLWKKKGKKCLYELSASTNTSLFKPNISNVNRYGMHQNWTVVGSSDIDLITLDDFCEAKKLKIDFVKLDT